MTHHAFRLGCSFFTPRTVFWLVPVGSAPVDDDTATTGIPQEPGRGEKRRTEACTDWLSHCLAIQELAKMLLDATHISS